MLKLGSFIKRFIHSCPQKFKINYHEGHKVFLLSLLPFFIFYVANCSVPLFEREGLGEIFLNKSPSIPLFQRGRCEYLNPGTF
jgi:hypothetical protein